MQDPLDICGKDSGIIWHRKPVPQASDALLTSIIHRQPSSTLYGRIVRLLRATFDSTGHRFAIGDQQGHIYVFDLSRNRFSLVQRLGTPCTTLTFNTKRKTELIIALADYSVRCVDIESGEMLGIMRGHDSSVRHISVHVSGRYALTTATDRSILWDLNTFRRKRTLNGAQDVGVQKAFFLPLSNTILTCFKDDSIMAWEADTFCYRYRLCLPDSTTHSPQLRAYATTQDGRTLATAGKSQFIYVWALDTRKLIRIVQMPKAVTQVREMEFLFDSFSGGANQVLAALASHGVVYFMNVLSCKMMFTIGNREQMIDNFTISNNGWYMACGMESGRVNMYSLQVFTSDVNQPPGPLVKAVRMDEAGLSYDEPTTASLNHSIHQQPLARVESATKQKPVTRSQLRPPPSEQSESDSEPLVRTLNTDRLKTILRGYGQYPEKYRLFIWRSLLQLPENHAAYASLADRGTHDAYIMLHKQYPIKSRKLLRVLQRSLSALAHWAPIFGEMTYLPFLAFPFVKMFQNNALLAFETIATVITNWCSRWFEYFPNPPFNVLNLIENLLSHHDALLMKHFICLEVTAQTYAWPLMQSFFSEVLTRSEWLKLWDNLFSHHPGCLLYAVVAYLIHSRRALLNSTEKDDFVYFFHHRNAVDVDAVIQEIYHLQETTPSALKPERVIDSFQPLTKGQYPIFNKYPKFVVDYQVKERDRLRREEMTFLHEHQRALELKRQAEERKLQEEAWFRQQTILHEAEEQRRRALKVEDQKLVDQRLRLQALKREVKTQELQVNDAARRRFMHYQQLQQEAEIKRLDDELQRKILLREQETKAAIEDAETQGMEIENQRELLEQEMAKQIEEDRTRLRSVHWAHDRQAAVEKSLLEGALAEQQQEDRAQLLEAQKQFATSQQSASGIRLGRDVESRLKLDNLEREIEQADLARRSQLTKLSVQELQTLLKRAEIEQREAAVVEQTKLDFERQLSSKADERRRGWWSQPNDDDDKSGEFARKRDAVQHRLQVFSVFVKSWIANLMK
ncbi:TBC1 domain family member 31-like isoform X2 [Corticium candelabrum]|uniref:TBC1 domain family member 31-like isoform X2 n=1 Tax=Corticium candelabrum TaxID=121492 RepID=UPI002E25C85D|nr:TBC1 domain family member 31-like isoform X2 [Corticium candelabrum]